MINTDMECDKDRHGMIKKNWLYSAVIGILIGYIVIILGSWLWSAAMPSSSIRTLLSESGIRWFFGTFAMNLVNTPLLIWIVLIDIAIGACIRSGLWNSTILIARHSSKLTTLQKRGLRSAIELIIFEICVVSLLILPRHAILLSVTGEIYPSSASACFVPIVAFMILSSSISYGLLSGTIHGYRDAVACTLKGGKNLKIILCFYILLIELAAIIKYIFFSMT